MIEPVSLPAEKRVGRESFKGFLHNIWTSVTRDSERDRWNAEVN